ncbi:MAG: histidine phosphatase family protein [Erysipelotrichaceae bacterium]|nr:histidine phosphatase family protein [Erysipelotrichaceae bacterium]
MGLLYITRHGETELNILDKMQGSIDSPLTKRGIRQAEALGKRLEDVKIDRIYVSHLPRAITTAKIIKGERDIDIIIDKGLAERDFGEWEGRVAEEIFKELGTTKQYAYTHPLEIEPVKGEKHLAYTKRVYDCFVHIAKENIDKDILIVTHGVTIKVIAKILANKTITDPDDLLDQIPQASITLGKYDDEGFGLLYRNDIKHLEGIE